MGTYNWSEKHRIRTGFRIFSYNSEVQTPSQAYNRWIRNLEPTPSEKESLRELHLLVREVLRANIGLDPSEGDFLFGSYKNHTQISLSGDIDLISVLNSNKYGFLANNLNKPELTLKFVAGILEKHLGSKIASTKIWENCITIKFFDSPWKMDIVPAFTNERPGGEGTLLIPDTKQKKFIVINPKADQWFLTNANQRSQEKLKPTIKMIKSLSKKFKLDISSTYVSMLLANQRNFRPKNYRKALIQALEIIQKQNLKPIANPGVMNELFSSNCKNKDKTLNKIHSIVKELKEAYRLEKGEKKKKSLEMIKEVLGDDFYESERN